MADESVLNFVLNLDNTEFLKAAGESMDSIQEIGSSDSMAGLITGLADVGTAMGVVGLAAFAFKEALDLTIEGEQIQQIQNQFNTLANQAGINGAALKAGLEEASGGLIDTTDLLKVANKAIVTMGTSAEKLPELLELARKASLVMGGTVEENFNNITQAIEAGNQKMLKRMGLNVDITASEQKLAAAQGVTAAELSNTGKQQAILNAVLEEGSKKFKDVNLDQQRTVDIMTQIKVTFKEVGEAFEVIFSQTIGPVIKAMATTALGMADSFKQISFKLFGSDAQKAAIEVQALKTSIANTTKQIEYFKGIIANDARPKAVEQATASLKDQEAVLVKLQTQLKSLDKTQQEGTQRQLASTAQVSAAAREQHEKDLVNAKEKEKTDNEVNQALLKLNAAALKSEEALGADENRADEIIGAARVQRAQTNAEAIKKINEKYGKDSERAKALVAAQNNAFVLSERVEEQKTAALRVQLLQNYTKSSDTAFQGVERAAKAMTLNAKKDLADMGKFGDATMNDFKKNSTNAFAAIGTGIAQGQNVAQAAANAMKGFFLNMLGDRAQAEGELLLLSGIWPPNPLALAAGGGLIALGAALKSLAGSAGGGVSSSGVSGGGGGAPSTAAPSAAAATDQSTQLQQQQQVQRSVSVNIAGNYLNTAESQRSIMEIMRNETDSTGFQYNKIGVG